MKVSRHCSEYGFDYPPESTKYFFDNKLYEYRFDNDVAEIYNGIDVFYELHKVNNYRIGDELSVSGGGIYIDTNEYHAFSQSGKIFGRKKYLVMHFMADEEYEYECGNGNVDYVTIINKKTGEMYTNKCCFYESGDRYDLDYDSECDTY